MPGVFAATTGHALTLEQRDRVKLGWDDVFVDTGLTADELRERGVDVVEVPYDPQDAGAALGPALREAADADLLLFASTARTILQDGEVALARALAGAQPAFVHVALWNPYLVASLPGPALVTFGWRDRSVRAAAAALLGEIRATATPPVELRTAT